MPRVARLAGALACLVATTAGAVQVDALDLSHEWRLRALRFHGNVAVKTRDLQEPLATKERVWFAVWRAWPVFDPVAFRADLERIRALYRSTGFYHARIEHDLELDADGTELVAVVYVEEGAPVYLDAVDVTLDGAVLAARERRRLLDHLPIVRETVFTEEAYNRAHTYLRTYYREHGYARVEVAKTATVDVARDRARVAYRVTSGPPCVFGETRIEGTQAVALDVVQNELAYDTGDPFRQSLLDRTRANLVALNLFRSVKIDEVAAPGERVDVRIGVVEQPAHEVRLGIGYDTEEEVRLLASWRDYNLFGGGRQLGFTARASFIHRAIAADFLQPHFPGRDNRTRLVLTEDEAEEDAYTLDRTRLSPRLEWQATPAVTGFAYYRIEYDLLSSIRDGLRRRFPGIAPDTALVSGFGTGAEWNTTDDLLDPSRGGVLRATIEPVGGLLGGDVELLRVVGEGRVYQPLPASLLLAARARIGAVDPLGGGEVPLFERFYAGGINSVRGYGRWRIGPLFHDEPVGGRSLVEGSLELRRPINDTFTAAAFLDAGQVSLSSWDLPVGDLRYGTGVGVRYKSPVGPIRVDLGFPLDPPRGDARWQIHVSVGAGF